MKFQSLLSLIVSLLILASCSSTQEAYIKNVNIFLDVKDGIQLTDEEIQAIEADLIYIVSGERPQATMALAFIEDGDYKWVSNDNVVFVMRNGRLKRSAGRDQDLLFVSNLELDPLKSGADLQTGASWTRYIDAESSFFGVKLSSEFQITKDASILIQDKSFQTLLVTEVVSFTSSAHDDSNWVNKFWYDKDSGDLLKSVQKSLPNSDVFEITYVSRALRLSAP